MHDESAVRQAVAGFEQNGQTVAVVNTTTHEEKDLHKLIANLDSESASTARGAMGKADFTAGLRLVATAYGDLAHDYKAMNTANPAPPAKFLATLTLDNTGRAKIRAGIKLLS